MFTHFREYLDELEIAIAGNHTSAGYKLEWRSHQMKGVIRLGFADGDMALIDLAGADESFLMAVRYGKADYPEDAGRAGSTTQYCFGDGESRLREYAWYNDNSGSKTHPVGKKKANAWGLYDMYGNVWEWCQDWHGDYPNGPVTDPIGPKRGSARVLRGGSWYDFAWDCRSAFRNDDSSGFRYCGLGFRVACFQVTSSGK